MPTPSNHSKQKKNYHPRATNDTNTANSVKPPGYTTNRNKNKQQKQTNKKQKQVNHPFIAHYLSVLVYHLTHWRGRRAIILSG
jgi:hypothetical protein